MRQSMSMERALGLVPANATVRPEGETAMF